MTRLIQSRFSLLVAVFTLSLLVTAFITIQPAKADNEAGPFISEKVRDSAIDFQQLQYTLNCMPTTVMENAEFPIGEVGSDMAIARLQQLKDWHVLDQGILGNVSGRGSMFPNEVLSCDNDDKYGFRWVFDNFGRADMVDFFCSLKGVYNVNTGGQGKTINGGTDKAACKAGKKFPKSYFVVAAGHNLREEAKAEFQKSKRGKLAATPLSPIHKYIQYWLAFSNTCEASLTSPYPKKGDPAAGNGAVFRISVVNQDGKVIDYVATTGGKSMDGTVIYEIGGAKTCGELSVGMRKYASDYAAYLKGPGKNDTGVAGTGIDEIELGTDTGTTEATTSCAVDNVGWIICPIVNFMAKIVDQVYKQVALLLTVTPITTNGGGTTLYSAWSTVRNIANVVFVIAFLVIIYSQITSVGISNYGVKKMLPKLFAAAILVNVSYWICSISVDISNILGNSLYELFNGNAFTEGIDTSQFEGDFTSTGSGWAGITAAVLASAAIIYFALPFLLTALVAAIIAIITVFLVLTLRQVLIILLIVISPLAFVALLLPNTESWFKKWRSLFQTLLLMYPIIAIIFGVSQLASTIVTNSATDIDGDGKFPIQMMGALITIIPLVLTPIIMKTAGGLLSRFGGMVNNPNKGPLDRMRKAAEGKSKDISDGRQKRAMDGSGLGGIRRYSARKKDIRARRESELGRSTAGYTSGVMTEQDANGEFTERAKAYQRAAAGGTAFNDPSARSASRVQAAAIAEQHKNWAEEVGEEQSTMTRTKHEDLMEIVKDKENQSAERRAAAAGVIASRSFREGHNELMNHIGDATNQDDSAMKDIQQQTISQMKSTPLGWGDTDKGDLGEGKLSVATTNRMSVSEQLMANRLSAGKVSEESIAGMDPDDLKIISKLHKENKLSPEAKANFGAVIDRLRANPTAYAASKEAARKIHDEIHPPTSTP